VQESIEALKTALRVLTAISERTNPEPADIETLKSYAPLLADAPDDELACDVIQQAIRRRADVRSKAGGA
jgi:hypothetical protein